MLIGRNPKGALNVRIKYGAAWAEMIGGSGMKEREVSEVLEEFLNYIDQCRDEYQAAHDAVGVEDKRLQDLLHDLELAKGENEKRRAGTRLQQSRRERRRNKDEVKRLRLVVEFFQEPAHKNTLNKMRQLLGRQRKEEEYLNGERVYKPRVTKQTERQ